MVWKSEFDDNLCECNTYNEGHHLISLQEKVIQLFGQYILNIS